MITTLEAKPNIFHAVRAMKPAHNKTWTQGSAAAFQRHAQLPSYFCSESTDLFIFPGFLQKRAGDKGVLISLQLAKSFCCSTAH